MDDIYDIANFEDFGDDDDLPFSEAIDVAEVDTYYKRSNQYWMQVPMPAECAPVGGAPLALLDDETLLTMSPALIMHAQRTAATGGLQVVSPRVVPLASSAAHTALPHRTTDMFLVGSNASRNLDWPVIRDPVDPSLFPEEPIDAYPFTPAIRPETRSVGIAAAAQSVRDPVVKAFLIGRALVDLQRRPDVAGSGDILAAHVASSWGLPPDTYEGMAEASLAPMGSLLRYAIRADTAYPTLNAPIHARKCISVGANTAGRVLYGEHAAIDWRRLRVLSEAVFYMSARLEGHSLAALALQQPPGDPKASPTRAGILQMRPLPGSVWTHDPRTFRLDISRTDPPAAAIEYPERISRAVEDFYKTARPIAAAAWASESVNLVPTVSAQPRTHTRESVIAGFTKMLQMTSTFSARGKTSNAAVRDYVYQCLSGSPSLAATRTLWLARYLGEVASDCALSPFLDSTLTRQLASRLSDFVHDLRIRLAVESNRRGATLDEWWEDMRALLPARLAELSEGSASWAIAVAHFLIVPFSSKWSNLPKAIGIASHKSMSSGALQSVRLPAEIGGPSRVFEAASATARSLAGSYGAYYGAMYEVGCMLAGLMKRMGNPEAAYKLRVAAEMWDIRAKAASSVELHLDDGTSTEAGLILGRTGQYHLTTAPYPAYSRWHEHINSGRVVSMASRRVFPHHITGPVSAAFVGRRDPLFPMGGQARSRLFRYAACPERLAADLNRTLEQMRADIEAVLLEYESEEIGADIPRLATALPGPPAAVYSMDAIRPAGDTLWAMLAELAQEDALDTEDVLYSLPQDVQDVLMAGQYSSPQDMRSAVLRASGEREAAVAAGRDLVM